MSVPSCFDLSGRNALITGGGSGLGFAIAKAIAAAGAGVILVGRDLNKLSRAGAELCALGANANWAVCDLLNRESIAPLIERLEHEVGPIDILFNNAGVQHRAPLTEFPAKEAIGGYWSIVAETLEQAADIANGNPCLEYGATVEVRPIMSDTPEVQIAPPDPNR